MKSGILSEYREKAAQDFAIIPVLLEELYIILPTLRFTSLLIIFLNICSWRLKFSFFFFFPTHTLLAFENGVTEFDGISEMKRKSC